MPQMAPMNWLTLFIFFSLLFLMFNMMNFYMFLYKPSSKVKAKSSLKYNWTW